MHTIKTLMLAAAAAGTMALIADVALAQDAADSDAALLIVGHNPGLEQCATLLAREPVKPKEAHRHDVMEEKFPTAALAVLDFKIPAWKKLSPDMGKLIDFVRPRDL